MSSLIYDSCLYNVFRSMIHFDTDTFRMLLVSSSYSPSKNHAKRSDIYDEIPSGNGYIQGGLDADVQVSKDGQNSRVNIILGSVTWTNASITAAGAIYYRIGSSGASTDDLVCFIEFDREAKSENGSFTVTQSVLRVQN